MLGGLERVRGGEKVVIRARERKEEKPICSSRLSRSCFTLSRAYESCFACRTLISNSVGIKHGLRTADYGLRIKYGLGIKRGLRTGYKMRATDYFGTNGANWF